MFFKKRGKQKDEVEKGVVGWGDYRLFEQIGHINKSIPFNETLHVFIFLFFCSDGAVILKHLWYVKYWKNKPGQKRGTDVFYV